MDFLTNVTGPPLAAVKPIRYGSYHILLTAKGFVVGDPRAFDRSSLLQDAGSLRTGSGFINGCLHLQSRRFPMYFPGSVPRLLLVSPHLAITTLDAVPPGMKEQIQQALPHLPELPRPDPAILRNVMPCFEIFQDANRRVPA